MELNHAGPRPYLSAEEETELGTFLMNCASVGYGKTRKDVLLIAESVAKEKDILKKECITSGWWNRFLKRQGDLSLRQSVEAPNLAASRSKKSKVSDLALQPNADIDPNTCCTCFVRYEADLIRGAGTEWISCTQVD